MIGMTAVLELSSRSLMARSKWFSTEERIFVLAIMSAVRMIGSLGGLYVPTLFVSDAMDNHTVKKQMKLAFVVFAIVSLI